MGLSSIAEGIIIVKPFNTCFVDGVLQLLEERLEGGTGRNPSKLFWHPVLAVRRWWNAYVNPNGEDRQISNRVRVASAVPTTTLPQIAGQL
jgi:hypothetical protein